jgi:hypothetical protein
MENFIKYSTLTEKHLTLYIELFERSLNEPGILSTINNEMLVLSTNLIIVEDSVKKIETEEDVFKISNSINSIVAFTSRLKKVLDFDVSRTSHLLSNTAVQNLVKQGQLLIRTLNNIEMVSYHLYKPSELVIDKVRAKLLCEKYPQATEILYDLVSENDGTYIEELKLKAYSKNLLSMSVASVPKPIDYKSMDVYTNLLQRYSYYSNFDFVPLAQFLKDKYDIKNAKVDKLSNIAKIIGSILVISKNTNALYRDHLMENYKPSGVGICKQLINDTLSITEYAKTVKPGIKLYRKSGAIVDVLKLRIDNFKLANKECTGIINCNESPSICKLLADETALILETLDGETYRKVHINPEHLFHLYNTPNPIIANTATEMGKSLDKHFKGARKFEYVNTTMPMEHIRENIIRGITSLLNSYKLKTIDNLQDFIYDEPKLTEIVNAELINAFDDFAKKSHITPFVYRESVISYMSLCNNKIKKFKTNLHNSYTKEEKTIKKYLQDGASIKQLLITVIKETLLETLNEKENIFNIINEKKLLFI